MDVTPSVRAAPTEPLTAPLVDAAARALARAFRDNAGFVAGLKIADRARRERRLVPIFRGFAATCARHGDAAVVRDAGGGVAAAALAYPPGGYPLRLAGWLQNARGVLAAGPATTIRLARLDAFMLKRHLATPHWYLFVLGVDPAHQGTGLGGALLRRLSRQADATGTDCFLETDMAQNVGLYRHHGYEVIDEGPTPLGFRMWHMHRPAARAATGSPPSSS